MLLICICSAILAGYVVYWLAVRQQHKIAVVDAVRLFDAFNMKKELEQMAKVKLQVESSQLDSIGNAFQKAKAAHSNTEDLGRLSTAYSYMQARLKQDYEQSNRDINEQVWKRLNPMMDAYGKKCGLHLIIGANGMGSVLYNDDYYDRTNDVIQYINKAYAGGN